MTTDPKTIERLRELAEKIANDLFTRGDGVKGGHFRMHSDNGEYLSGWSEGPLRDRVYAILVKESSLLSDNRRPMTSTNSCAYSSGA